MGAKEDTEAERGRLPCRSVAGTGRQDGLHLERTSVGQPESVSMEIIFDNRFLLGNSRICGFVFQNFASARCEKRKRLQKLV